MKTKFFCWLAALACARAVMGGDTPALTWDATSKECALKAGETMASFTFCATNVSRSPVVINRLVASCGCTVAKLPSMPYTLGAGSNVAVNVEMQLAGKYGLIRKTVTVDSSAGFNTLIVSANIPTDQKTTEGK